MDIRKVMEPHTAHKLKVSVTIATVCLLSLYPQALKNNVLRDFLHVAGPYGVTHLLMFSKSEVSANLVHE